jgi:glycosyltransferase involved in cell wall biosynthesis
LHGFAELGVEVHGIFLDDQVPDSFKGSTTLVRSVKSSGPLKKAIDRVRLIRAARRIRDRFDYVYTRFDPVLTSSIADKRTIVEYNDDFLEQIRFAARAGQFSKLGLMLRTSSAYSAIIGAMETRSFRNARVVACVTSGLCDVVARRAPGASVFLMRNGSSAFYQEKLDPRYDDNILRLGHVGTLTYWDGLTELFHALCKFASECRDRPVRLLVVGEGAMKEELEILRKKLSLEDIVEMRPAVSRSSALEILHRVDAVPLLKTIVGYGLSPIKYYEALCTGRVILASDVPHINDLEPDEGMVVSYPLKVDEIADAIGTLHTKLADIRGGVAQRSSKAVARHSWTRRVEELMDYLEDQQS